MFCTVHWQSGMFAQHQESLKMPTSILGSQDASWEGTQESANPTTTASSTLNPVEGEAHSSPQGLRVPLDDLMPME